MKTFAQLMEQIPHMDPKPTDVARVKGNLARMRQLDRHMHGEFRATAYRQQKDKETHLM